VIIAIIFGFVCKLPPKHLVKDRRKSWGSSFCSTLGGHLKRQKHKRKGKGTHFATHQNESSGFGCLFCFLSVFWQREMMSQK
jgi:hypothetical protein